MSDKFSGFLTSLSENPSAVQSFKSDPKGTMNAAGLSDDEKSAILSGDPKKVREMAGGDLTAAFVVILIL